MDRAVHSKGVDYSLRGGVKVLVDGKVLRAQGMRRGGLAGDPREPVIMQMVLENGDRIEREAQLVALDPKDRCWVYAAD